MRLCLQRSRETDSLLLVWTSKPPLGFHFGCISAGNPGGPRLGLFHAAGCRLSHGHDTRPHPIKTRAVNQQADLGGTLPLC